MQKKLNKKYTYHSLFEDGNEINKQPSLYQVIVHNDDFTPMEFVVEILEQFFYMDRRRASEVMFEAHVKGQAICGIYSKDFAESKMIQIKDYAKLNEYPLILSIEMAE